MFTVELTRERGYYLHYIVLQDKFGESKIFDDLLKINYLNDFYPAKRIDPDGYFSATISYFSETYGLALLKFSGNVQTENHGVVRSTVATNDFMLFDQIKPNQFIVYILKNAKRKENRYYKMHINGEFDAEMADLKSTK